MQKGQKEERERERERGGKREPQFSTIFNMRGLFEENPPIKNCGSPWKEGGN